jgi:hypothetical protein
VVVTRLRSLSPTELDAYAPLPRALAMRVRVVRVPLLAPGTAGMTLGRFVLLVRDEPADGTSALLAHELVHVRQWHELGVLRFLWQYLGAYASNLVRLRSHDRAYRAIPLEVEAYDFAREWAATRRPA